MPYFKNICPLLLLLHCGLALTVADFKPALFHSSRPSGFYQVNTGTENTGLVLALDDLNGDQYTDYIATDDPTTATLTAFLWDDARSLFYGVDLALNQSNFASVAEAMICDVDSDKEPEIVVTFLMKDGLYSSQIYDVNCRNRCTISQQPIDHAPLTAMNALPFLVDIEGTGHISFFIFSNNTRSVVEYDLKAPSRALKSTPFSKYIVNPGQNYNPVSLHFAANIDFNGDCNSDLIIVSKSSEGLNSILEFYQKSNGNTYQQLSTLSLAKNISWLTYADLDQNGAVDVFLVTQNASTFTPYVMLNPNIPYDICATNSKFPFSNLLQQVILPPGYSLSNNSNIKFADINLDGLPDMVGLFAIGKFKRATILVNSGGLTFSQFGGVNIESVSTIDNPVQACAFDLAQNGKVDLIVINQVPTEGGGSAYVRTAVLNNIIDDSLFIKILPVLSTSDDDLNSHQINSAIGVTVQWRITNLNGDKTIALLNQKPQWNFGTLHLPFVTGGLGRTNNYIEDLAVGYPGRGAIETWTPIIPNSQLMVRRQAEGQWDLQTLLKDNSRVYDVIYISIICLFMLGLVVFYLNWRQNQQDKRDHYNFIQMIR